MDPRSIWLQTMHHGLGLELEGTIAVVDSLSKSAAESQRILNKMERYLWQQQMIRQATAELSRERSDGHVEVFIRWKSLHTELELEMRQRMDDLEAEFRKREDRLEEVRKEEDRAVEQRWMQKSLKLSKSWYLEPSELPSKQTNGPFGGSTAKQQIIPTTTPSTSEENDDIKL